MDPRYSEQSDVIIIGAGGYARVIIDILTRLKEFYHIIGITDYDENRIGESILSVPIIGTDSVLDKLYTNGLRKAFIAIGTTGDFLPRLNAYYKVKSLGYELINVIDPSSVISSYAVMGQGNAILPTAVVNTEVKIGDHCIINTGSVIEHHCSLGNNVHVCPRAVLSGNVTVEENCMIGAGATIIQGIKIGKNSIIGAGSVVIKDVPSNAVMVGVPARKIKER